MISIIMPSYLGKYKSAAENRPQKLVRAIRSIQIQEYEDWELVIVCDGCMESYNIVDKFQDSRIILKFIPKQPIWSGKVRNEGIKEATGDYICYLDIDDAFAPGHLQGISKATNSAKDWYWTDDYVWNGKEFRHRKCNIHKVGQCGTSNLVHKKIAYWKEKDNYAHDWNFINNLKRASSNYKYFREGKYLVCHIPGKFDI